MPEAKAWKLIVSARRTLMLTHTKPDGDGLGSLAALQEALTALGQQVRIILPSEPAAKYAFLAGSEKFEVLGRDVQAAQLPRDWDLLLVVDTCTWDQLEGLRGLIEDYCDRVLVVDHHMTRDDLRHQELVDVDAAAAGEIVARLMERHAVAVTPTIAESLFVALVSDTGWFRFPSVTPAVLHLGARLVEQGARPSVVYERLYQSEPLAKMNLLREALSTLAVSPEGDVAWFWLTRDMFARSGAKLSDTENIIDECQKVVGVLVGLLFTEIDDGSVRVSLRSKRDVDMAAVSAGFGGGGHARAAGCHLPGPLPVARRAVLEAVYAAMGRPPCPWM
jgi:phosphoesterase RecJ-like protein